MKKLLFAFMLFSCVMGFSQEDDEKYAEILGKQIETLQLTGEKKDAFVEISDKYYEKIKATRKSEGSRMTKFKELKSIQDSKNEELKELLSEEEFKAFKDLQKENRAMLKDRYKQKSKS